jgi:hypothetical protein
MPRGDRTGPQGMGPRSGRAAGFCAGFGMPEHDDPAPSQGFGMGFGRGRGRGWRHMFTATGVPGWQRFGRYAVPFGCAMPYQKIDSETEKQALKSQAEVLQSELDFIKKRLSEIETGTEEA